MCEEITKDSNGTQLENGDSVILTQDLKLRGSSTVMKVGTVVKNIRLNGNPEEIEYGKGKETIVLKTCYLKKKKDKKKKK